MNLNCNKIKFEENNEKKIFEKFQLWFMKINELNYAIDFEISNETSEAIQKDFKDSLKEMTIDDFDRCLNLTKLYCLSKGSKNMLLEDYEFIRKLEKMRIKDLK